MRTATKVKTTIGLKRGEVRLVKYSHEWPKSFEAEARKLRKVFGKIALDIQHIGSTSISSIVAKPIIDIGLIVPSLRQLKWFRSKLRAIGYYPKKNDSKTGRLFFTKGPEALRTHYLHIGEKQGGYVKKMILFRDYLRSHPRDAKEYSALKRKLAARYERTREIYTEKKKKFISAILRKAKKSLT